MKGALSLHPPEIGALAGEMAKAYAGVAKYYRDQLEMPPAEADAKAHDVRSLAHLRLLA